MLEKQSQFTTELSAHAVAGTIVSTVVDEEYPIARAFAAVVVSTAPLQCGALGKAVPPYVIVQVAGAPVPTVTLPDIGVEPATTAGEPAPHADATGKASILNSAPMVPPKFWPVKMPSAGDFKIARPDQ